MNTVPVYMPYITSYFMVRCDGDRPAIVPEVFDSIYDIRQLLRAMYYMGDKKKLVDQEMPMPEKLAIKTGMKKIKKTWMAQLLKEANLM